MIIPYEIIYFGIGFIAAFIVSVILLLVVMKRLKQKIFTPNIDLEQIKNIIENSPIKDVIENKLVIPIDKPKYKFVSKDIEIVDINEENTDK